MHKSCVFFTKLITHFSDSFQKGLTFNVTHRTTDFNKCNFSFTGASQQVDPTFYFIGNVRNHLNRPPQIVPSAFTLNHLFVNLTGCYRAGSLEPQITETLIMSKVKIRFRAIIKYINFTMLVWAHGTWVNIKVRIKFLYGYGKAAGFKQPTDRSCCYPFANRREYSTSKEYVFDCHITSDSD